MNWFVLIPILMALAELGAILSLFLIWSFERGQKQRRAFWDSLKTGIAM